MTRAQAPIIIWWRMSGRSAILEWVAGTDATDTDGSARQLQGDLHEHAWPLPSGRWSPTLWVVPEYYENEADRKGVDRYQHLQQQLD